MLTIKNDGKYGDNLKYVELTDVEVKKLARTQSGEYYNNALKVSGAWHYRSVFIEGPEGGHDPFLGEKYYSIVFSVDNQMFSFHMLPVVNSDGSDWADKFESQKAAFPISFGGDEWTPPIKEITGINFTNIGIY